MRLKRLEMYGYKSFASRTVFEFGEGMTAIVGPNGSGKSNIADAIRWVMGEQSHRSLRARSTQDMIFAGSRSRAGVATATRRGARCSAVSALEKLGASRCVGVVAARARPG